MKLSLKDIREIKSIEGINNRKDKLQDNIIQAWGENNRKGLVSGFTGFGKSYLVTKAIKLINTTNPEYVIHIIAPTTKLVDDFNKNINKYNLQNTTVHTIHSYSKYIKENGSRNTDVLIIDEAHTCANVNSEFFSEVLPNTNYKNILCLSATFEDNHLKYFNNLGLDIISDIPIEDGLRMNLIPDYITYCIGVNLTEEEKIQYIKFQKQYDNYLNYFKQYDFDNPIGAITAVIAKKGKLIKYQGVQGNSEFHAKRIAEYLKVSHGTVIGIALKWIALTSQRARFLNNSENLVKGSSIILSRIQEKTIVFCSGKDSIKYIQNKLPLSTPYHSGLSDKTNIKNLDEFENGNKLYLLTAKKLDQGYNLENLRLGLQFGYTSKKLQFIQRRGRIGRFDPNNPEKVSVLICVYVKDFIHDGVVIKSQQLKWLKSALIGSNYVEWIENLEDIKI